MLTELTIPKRDSTAPRPAAQDYGQLYALGLEHVRRLSSRIWTDYNVHDPGITTLELLCYALTDLGYRAGSPVADLLASETGNDANMRKQFFSARQIFHQRPLTLLDYRKLLIDLKGVKNAWLLPAEQTYYADRIQEELSHSAPGVPVRLGGLYKVLIDFMDDLAESDRPKTIDAVWQCLHANRNLAEDFVAVESADPQPFIVCGELELSPQADVAEVHAQVLFAIQQYLAPAVANYSLSEMLARTRADGSAYAADEIFNGPALECGFIPDDELEQAELRTRILLSDVISLVMDIPGVVAVRDLLVNPKGVASLSDKWVVEIDTGKKAQLDIAKSRLVSYKRAMPMMAKPGEVEARYKQLADAARQKVESPDSDNDFAIPLGRYRAPGAYTAFQNHFPMIYGVSEFGLPPNAGGKRQAQVYQLKAYLLFFEQIMAHYFAQLAHVRDLFSTDPALERTCFYQVVDSFRDYDRIYATSDPVATWQDEVEDKDALIDRRNRFLDHLIARFAEQFTDYAHIAAFAFGFDDGDMVRLKCDFLNAYPAIGSERGLAYNYSLSGPNDMWDSGNVSGLERRVARLLDMPSAVRRNLSEITLDAYAEVEGNAADEFRFRIRHRDGGAVLLSSNVKYPTGDAARAAMRHAIETGSIPAGYEKKTTDSGKFYFNVVDEDGKVLARRIEYFDTEEAMERAQAETIAYLRMHYSVEGMYLIENILLRPAEEGDPFLPICVDKNCSDCADLDPYSWRLHIVLPAYGPRFSNMDFRRYAEEVIRAETPAHLLPKICWIARETMAEFEPAYRDWIALRCGADTADRTKKLEVFIKLMYQLKNVYPSERLRGCESESKFVVGRTALGSIE